MIYRSIVYTFIACCLALSGCSDSPKVGQLNWDKESKLIERCVFSAEYPGAVEWVELCNKIRNVDHENKIKVLRMFSRIMASLKLNDKNYALRYRSLGVYLKIVKELGFCFAEKQDVREEVVDFLLGAFGVFRREYETVSAFDSDWGRWDFGVGLSRDDYLSEFYAERFNAIRGSFEYGWFSSYYYSLPIPQQAKLLSRIEAVAERKVVIYNPDDPKQPMPQFEFQFSKSFPRETREMLEKVRRDALKKMESAPGVPQVVEDL